MKPFPERSQKTLKTSNGLMPGQDGKDTADKNYDSSGFPQSKAMSCRSISCLHNCNWVIQTKCSGGSSRLSRRGPNCWSTYELIQDLTLCAQTRDLQIY